MQSVYFRKCRCSLFEWANLYHYLGLLYLHKPSHTIGLYTEGSRIQIVHTLGHRHAISMLILKSVNKNNDRCIDV